LQPPHPAPLQSRAKGIAAFAHLPKGMRHLATATLTLQHFQSLGSAGRADVRDLYRSPATRSYPPSTDLYSSDESDEGSGRSTSDDEEVAKSSARYVAGGGVTSQPAAATTEGWNEKEINSSPAPTVRPALEPSSTRSHPTPAAAEQRHVGRTGWPSLATVLEQFHEHHTGKAGTSTSTATDAPCFPDSDTHASESEGDANSLNPAAASSAAAARSARASGTPRAPVVATSRADADGDTAASAGQPQHTAPTGNERRGRFTVKRSAPADSASKSTARRPPSGQLTATGTETSHRGRRRMRSEHPKLHGERRGRPRPAHMRTTVQTLPADIMYLGSPPVACYLLDKRRAWRGQRDDPLLLESLSLDACRKLSNPIVADFATANSPGQVGPGVYLFVSHLRMARGLRIPCFLPRPVIIVLPRVSLFGGESVA
jgi:hypothetical protein